MSINESSGRTTLQLKGATALGGGETGELAVPFSGPIDDLLSLLQTLPSLVGGGGTGSSLSLGSDLPVALK